MFKVTRVKNQPFLFHLAAGLRNASNSMETKRVHLVSVQDENGHTGYGEAWLEANYLDFIEKTVSELSEQFVLNNAPALARLNLNLAFCNDTSNRPRVELAAISALDMALWDLEAKQKQLSLTHCIAQVFNLAPVKQQVSVYASGGLYHADEDQYRLADEVKQYLSSGFDKVKVKVGGLPLEQDVARLKAVREQDGNGFDLYLDANSALNINQTNAILSKLSALNSNLDIGWLEEPLPLGNYAPLPTIAASTDIPLCGYEGEAVFANFELLIASAAVDVIQLDISICGGITQGQKILTLCQQKNIPATLHTAASAVLYTANLHLAAAQSTPVMVESHQLHQWLFEHLSPRFTQVDAGKVTLPECIGSGFSPDEKFVKEAEGLKERKV